MEEKRTVLVVDDDPNLVDLLRLSLERSGYKVLTAHNGDAGERAFSQNPVNLVLLDVMMPRRDGFTLCKEIRSRSNVPIIMLTARQETEDIVRGLELGADDYITKPFNLREVIARVSAVLSRVQRHIDESPSPLLGIGDISLDPERGMVLVGGTEKSLTPIEFELLHFFMTHPGRLYEREALLKEVWGYDYFGKTNLVDVAVRRLREKVEPEPSNPIYLLTVRGQGYRFVSPSEVLGRS